MTALDEFKQVVEQFGTIGGYAIGGTVLLPIVTAASGLAPPWPSGLPFVACLLMVIVLALVFHFLPAKRRSVFSAVFATGCALLVVSLALQVYLYSQFVVPAPRTGVPVILGCEWTGNAVLVAEAQKISTADQCPGDYQEMLASADFDPAQIWKRTSIANIAYLLAVTWVTIFVSLALALGSFVVWYSRQRARRVPA